MHNTAERIIAFISVYQEANDYSPTILEIAVAVDRVPSVVHYHITRLARSGRIHYTPNTARTITLTSLT